MDHKGNSTDLGHTGEDQKPDLGTMELSTEILIMIGIMLLSIIGGNMLRK